MAADQQQFLQLVENLMSGENDIRNQAETTYDSIPPETKIPYLMENILNITINTEVRQMAALLMRRLFTSTFEEFHPKLAPDIQIALREQLLLAIQQQEAADSLRKKICDAVAELARNLIDDNGVNQWPEILKFLFDCASSNDPALKESALHIFTAVPGIFGNQQTQYLDVIKQMLYQCLQDELLQVRFAAVKAIVAFLLSHEKDFPIQKHFVDCLAGIIQAITDSLATQEDDAIIKCLIDLAEACPRFLRHQIENIINLCMKLLADTNVEDAWRHLALEVVVTLSETAPAMVRKYSKFIPLLIPQILTLMVQLDEDQNWSTSDEVTDDDSDSNAIAGESALDRIACGLGGKTVLPFIISNIPQMLSSPDWKYRHAALMAISAVGEGCHKQMEGILPQIMEGVLPFLQDTNPRVRYAACNAIGQMSTDFAPNFEKKFHDKVIPGLLMVMDDNDNPRVQAHAGAALVNFSEDCPKTLLTQYLDAIMSKLEMILNHKFKELVERGTKLVLEQVVTTIASVADTAEEKFIDYYDRFMPCLKYIVQNANSPELRLLRGKTIECISLIGLAVGREKFMQDASEVMELLLKAQINQQEMEEDDPQISYMIAAWARMCKILGKQFEQYLPVVMGPVMKTASLKPEVALLDSEDMKAVSEDDDWQFVSLGDQQQNFGIRTAGLEDKATACRMLACYARELKGGFVEYSEQVVKLMVPMLKFYFHDGVRMAAAESLPYLLECAKIKGEGYVTDMWNYINPELLKAIDIEPENDVLSEHMTALAQCIETLGKGCLKELQLIELFRILDKTLKEHFVRAAERQEKRKDEDYDEVVEESLLEEDDEDVFTLSKVSDVLHALFSTYKEDIFPYFDQLLPHVVRLLGADRSWSDHQWGLCVFDDVLEHGGLMSVKYQQYFLPQMLDFLNDKSPEVRQAAAYGVGVMGQFAGEPFAHVCAEAMPSLLNMINKPDSRSPENVNATENAIASVTKVLKYNHSCVNVDEILAHWLTWLPVWEDEAEAPHVYGYLCDLIESNHPVILGVNNGNLPRILSIMAEAFVKEAVDEEADITKRMVNIVRQIQSNSDVFSACLSQLSIEQQQALHNVLTTH